MQMIYQPAAAWSCVIAGLLLHAGWLGTRLKRHGGITGFHGLDLLLPGALAILCAKGGFELLQTGESYAVFRWCYTTGLLGLCLGTGLTARIRGAKVAGILDETAAATCIAMALARLSQRWLGETGMGPILDEAGFWAMINDWEEPVLAMWMLEAGACVLAAAATGLWHRRSPRAAGGTFCGMIHFLLEPQIMLEQFRSGEYMRFMMMRLEQVLFAQFGLGTLIWLGVRIRKAGSRGAAAWAPAAAYLMLAGAIALAEFLLDGKIMDAFPEAAAWAIFATALAGMIATAVWAVRRLDQVAEKQEV